MNLPVVSVIIPVYHDWDRLMLCLEALKEQSYPKDLVEVIVVNNDPSDATPDKIILQSNTSLINEPKPGSYAARNSGIKVAKGDVLAFTDSDCIPEKDWLMNGVICLTQNDNVGIVAGKVSLFYKSEKLNAVEVYEKYTAFKQESNAKSGSCVGANWFSYKSVIEKFGMFDASLKSNGDTVLSVKISNGGYKVIYADNAIVLHPSRSTFKEIGNKYRRLFGGNYDRAEGSKTLFSYKFIGKFIFRRLRFSLRKMVQVSPAESLKLLIVNFYLFYALVSEASLLAEGRKSKRL